MKNSILRKRLEIFMQEIIKGEDARNVKPINQQNINNHFNNIFTDFSTNLILKSHKELLKILVENIQNKNWDFVYACLKMIWNLKFLRIEINLEKLEYIKSELNENKEKECRENKEKECRENKEKECREKKCKEKELKEKECKENKEKDCKSSYFLLNKMLKEKYFVIIEDYKEFEIELEYNRIKKGVDMGEIK